MKRLTLSVAFHVFFKMKIAPEVRYLPTYIDHRKAANFRTVTRKAGGKPHRWRTPSQLHRRGKWAGPKSSELRERADDTISNYSNPDYIIGNSTPAALDTLSARFQQSTLELDSVSRYELDSREVPVHELDANPLSWIELPTRTWPDHLTLDGEHDQSPRDPDGGPKGYWM